MRRRLGPGGAPAQGVDLAAVVEGAVVQLYGVVGAPSVAVQADAAEPATARLVLDRRDEAKLRSALALVSAHGDRPLRLQLEPAP